MPFNTEADQAYDLFLEAYRSNNVTYLASLAGQAQLKLILKDIASLKMYIAAVLALSFWEWCVTFNRERMLYWRRKGCFSPIRILFFLNRYYGLAFAIASIGIVYSETITNDQCSHLYLWQPISFTLILAFCQGIMGLRIWVIHDRNRIIAAVLSIAWITCVACSIAALALGYFSPVPIAPAFGLTGCLAQSRAPRIFLFWIPPFVYDMIVFALTAVKLLTARKINKKGLMGVLIRDGMLYFTVIASISIVNIVFYSVARPSMQSLNAPCAVALTSCMCSRIVITTSEHTAAAYHDASINDSSRMRSLSRSRHVDNLDGYNTVMEDARGEKPTEIRVHETTHVSGHLDGSSTSEVDKEVQPPTFVPFKLPSAVSPSHPHRAPMTRSPFLDDDQFTGYSPANSARGQ